MKQQSARPLKVEDPDNKVPRPVLATAIVAISKGVRDLRASGLNERAVILLVADRSRIARPKVKAVIDALDQLAADYTR